jgi:hypothetical protein
MANDVNLLAVNIGALSGTARPLFKIPDGWGGIKILHASAVQVGSVSTQLYLVTMGAAGTAVGGTLTGMIGGSVDYFAANVPKAFVFGTAYVAQNTYVGIQETLGTWVAGTTSANALLSLAYLTGGAA